jgi:hypothetical protein
MSLVRNLSPPARGTAVVGTALGDLQGSAQNDSLLGGGAVDLSQPLPLFQLWLSDIKNGFDFSAAHLVGWRYLIESTGSNDYAYADVQDSSSGEPKFAGLANNKNATRLMDAVRIAEQVAKSIPSDCEARVLDVPALKFSALWLDCGQDSMFIPFIDRTLSGGGSVGPETSQQISKRLLVEADAVRAAGLLGRSSSGAATP